MIWRRRSGLHSSVCDERVTTTLSKTEASPTDRASTLFPRHAGRWWLTALGVGIIAEYATFIGAFFRQSGPQDADQYLVFHALQYWNASLFGIAKQWTPLMCSGMSMAGEPQIPFMSLTMGLTYMLGPLWGVKLGLVLYLAIGAVGAYLYAGLWLKGSGQRALAAVLFIGNGFFFCRLGMGHFDFAPFLILPFVLWVLHRSSEWRQQAQKLSKLGRMTMASWGMGAILALAIDGSPVAIIHLVFWIGLYALSLSWTTRTMAPAIVFGGAVALTAVLDAGYLWPMLQAQTAFPRITPDQFTNPFSAAWFALLPIRGKILQANGNGHELSVFIGPLLALCIWRYRALITATLPIAMKRPLVVVSIVSLVLGMGSLRGLHIPIYLSPFDLLRPLPGFRSIGVTGRYWGFLALPLSLLSAAALWKYCVESAGRWHMHLFLGCALILQLGFQAETLTRHWLHSPVYRLPAGGVYFRNGPESVDYVAADDNHEQGEYLTPTRGVANCYDMDDFNRAPRSPGNTLIERVLQDGKAGAVFPVTGKFASWNRIHLEGPCALSGEGRACLAAGPNRVSWVLGQAYHPLWRASSCELSSSMGGLLTVDCPGSTVSEGPIDLVFNDAISDYAAHISLVSWELWAGVTLSLLFLFMVFQRRVRRSTAIGAFPRSECTT